MYKATTRAIQVTVEPQYLPDQSEPAKSQYVWAYAVRIENGGDVAVQLRSRHWKITDGLGRLTPLSEIHSTRTTALPPHLRILVGENLQAWDHGKPLQNSR